MCFKLDATVSAALALVLFAPIKHLIVHWLISSSLTCVVDNKRCQLTTAFSPLWHCPLTLSSRRYTAFTAVCLFSQSNEQLCGFHLQHSVCTVSFYASLVNGLQIVLRGSVMTTYWCNWIYKSNQQMTAKRAHCFAFAVNLSTAHFACSAHHSPLFIGKFVRLDLLLLTSVEF